MLLRENGAVCHLITLAESDIQTDANRSTFENASTERLIYHAELGILWVKKMLNMVAIRAVYVIQFGLIDYSIRNCTVRIRYPQRLDSSPSFVSIAATIPS